MLIATQDEESGIVSGFDGNGRLVSKKDRTEATTSYTYTDNGQVETITDALGGLKSYTYDLLGRMTSETNEENETTLYGYDALGRVTSVTNPLGNTDSFTYDLMWKIKTVTDKNGNETGYNYDANGNIIETLDALGNMSQFEYDKMNRLVSEKLKKIDPRPGIEDENQITLYEYDKRGLVTREINAALNETLYVYE